MIDGINKNQEKVSEVQSWEDLFRLVMKKTKQDIRCSTLAFFDSIEQEYNEDLGYGIAKMKPFPLLENQDSYVIYAYFFKQNKNGEDFIEGRVGHSDQKIYAILFMDNNFKSNLKENEPIKTVDTTVHSVNFGIIIDTL